MNQLKGDIKKYERKKVKDEKYNLLQNKIQQFV